MEKNNEEFKSTAKMWQALKLSIDKTIKTEELTEAQIAEATEGATGLKTNVLQTLDTAKNSLNKLRSEIEQQSNLVTSLYSNAEESAGNAVNPPKLLLDTAKLFEKAQNQAEILTEDSATLQVLVSTSTANEQTLARLATSQQKLQQIRSQYDETITAQHKILSGLDSALQQGIQACRADLMLVTEDKTCQKEGAASLAQLKSSASLLTSAQSRVKRLNNDLKSQARAIHMLAQETNHVLEQWYKLQSDQKTWEKIHKPSLKYGKEVSILNAKGQQGVVSKARQLDEQFACLVASAQLERRNTASFEAVQQDLKKLLHSLEIAQRGALQAQHLLAQANKVGAQEAAPYIKHSVVTPASTPPVDYVSSSTAFFSKASPGSGGVGTTVWFGGPGADTGAGAGGSAVSVGSSKSTMSLRSADSLLPITDSASKAGSKVTLFTPPVPAAAGRAATTSGSDTSAATASSNSETTASVDIAREAPSSEKLSVNPFRVRAYALISSP